MFDAFPSGSTLSMRFAVSQCVLFIFIISPYRDFVNDYTNISVSNDLYHIPLQPLKITIEKDKKETSLISYCQLRRVRHIMKQ